MGKYFRIVLMLFFFVSCSACAKEKSKSLSLTDQLKRGVDCVTVWAWEKMPSKLQKKIPLSPSLMAHALSHAHAHPDAFARAQAKNNAINMKKKQKELAEKKEEDIKKVSEKKIVFPTNQDVFAALCEQPSQGNPLDTFTSCGQCPQSTDDPGEGTYSLVSWEKGSFVTQGEREWIFFMKGCAAAHAMITSAVVLKKNETGPFQRVAFFPGLKMDSKPYLVTDSKGKSILFYKRMVLQGKADQENFHSISFENKEPVIRNLFSFANQHRDLCYRGYQMAVSTPQKVRKSSFDLELEVAEKYQILKAEDCAEQRVSQKWQKILKPGSYRLHFFAENGVLRSPLKTHSILTRIEKLAESLAH